MVDHNLIMDLLILPDLKKFLITDQSHGLHFPFIRLNFYPAVYWMGCKPKLQSYDKGNVNADKH